jgi:hydrogenase 3 maturation protease
MSGTVVLGIGNPLGGDDAAGLSVVQMLGRKQSKPRAFLSAEITIIDAGTSPESYTSVIRRQQPNLLILVDAADMGLPPGAVRIIPSKKIRSLSFSTHLMPLSTFISYVREFCGNVLLIGVQPEQTKTGAPISKVVRKSATGLAKTILEGRVNDVPPMD